MNSRETGCLGVAAALALSALAGDASAEEATVSRAPTSSAERARSAEPSRTKAHAHPKASPLHPQLGRTSVETGLAPLLPTILPPASALRGAEYSNIRPGEQRIAAAETAAGAASSEEGSEQSAREQDALEAAERLLGDGMPFQLLQSVIVPAARGVTIAEIQTEGAGAVTLSVRPTKITRGSGLVAVGRF